MSYASAALSGGGGIVGAYGSIYGGQQTADTLEYQAKIQSHNASEATMAASLNADKQDMVAAKVIGGTRAGYAAAGVDASSGSVMSVIAASAANAELDKQNILHGGELRAVNYENQASMDRLGASRAIQASYINAFSSLLGGGASALKSFGGGSKGGGGDTEEEADAGAIDAGQ